MNENYIVQLEIKKTEALTGRNARLYTETCDELSVTPEDISLYEQGLAELVNEKREESILESILEKNSKNVIKANVAKFLKKSENISIYGCRDTASKRKLLVECFRRFKKDGSQNIANYTDSQVTDLFRNVYLSYKDKYK